MRMPAPRAAVLAAVVQVALLHVAVALVVVGGEDLLAGQREPGHAVRREPHFGLHAGGLASAQLEPPGVLVARGVLSSGAAGEGAGPERGGVGVVGLRRRGVQHRGEGDHEGLISGARPAAGARDAVVAVVLGRVDDVVHDGDVVAGLHGQERCLLDARVDHHVVVAAVRRLDGGVGGEHGGERGGAAARVRALRARARPDGGHQRGVVLGGSVTPAARACGDGAGGRGAARHGAVAAHGRAGP
mmetsp:Transcript_35807/g.88150  ORF Transcript_35807/g.88150 Transcript_35807/m.88150 type:complete len:244 (+) Transcript_35807:476-1207(+)